jgi:hypothetical protein
MGSPSAPIPFCRKVTIDKRNATPIKIVLASRILEATRPNASISFCFLRMGNNTTAVPMLVKATMISSIPPMIAEVSGPALRM